MQRDRIKALYKFDLQPKLNFYDEYLEELKQNSALRIENNKSYQTFLKELKKNQDTDVEDDQLEEIGYSDLQLFEAYDIMKDLLFLQLLKHREVKKTQENNRNTFNILEPLRK